MPQIKPVRQPKPVKLEFRFSVAPEWVERVINETGEEPPDEFSVEFDLREVSVPVRKLIRDAHRVYMDVEWYPELAEPTDDPTVIAATVLSRFQAEEQQREEEEREQTAREEAERAEREAQLNAMIAWIEQFGSSRLQRAAERGYNVARLYAIERTRREAPGFWVDFGSTANARARANPSEDALNLEERVDEYLAGLTDQPGLVSYIVWLREFPRDMQSYLDTQEEDAEQGEALQVEGWLGRYTIYLPVNPALRAPSEEES